MSRSEVLSYFHLQFEGLCQRGQAPGGQSQEECLAQLAESRPLCEQEVASAFPLRIEAVAVAREIGKDYLECMLPSL
ncbi:hypothetical protein [Pseudomarimonas arenosa]|uniref:Uncharacterized protein n=1 Tax=Pseudomarimonas arenosa TaxID=2774145 RepID=A0AAW3ZSP1_9GAMM|nr:hypothetical protein [Pseudomarimonas arenosa]MBD8528039.1 hypothetical protein [Pseudomarimonas arenosa]